MAHTKERVSEYIGTAKKTASTRTGGAKASGRLDGNWNEDAFDSRVLAAGKRSALPTELDHTWRSCYRHMSDEKAPPTAAQKAMADQLSATTRRLLTTLTDPEADKLSQTRMLDVVDGRHRAYPGHQPEQDLSGAAWKLSTETRDTYIQPRERLAMQKTNAADTYTGPAHDKAGFVIYKVRQQLHHKAPKPGTPSLGATPEAVIHANFAIPALRRALFHAEKHAPVAGLKKVDGKITLDELRVGMEAYGIALTIDEMSVLFTKFDRDGDGEVSVLDVVRGIRGDLNDRRRGVVQRAFKLLSTVVQREATALGKPGVAPVYGADVRRFFDANAHPEVKGGRCNAAFAAAHLFDDFAVADAKTRKAFDDKIITVEDFCELYADWGALVPADYSFEHAVRNCWHLSGGEGLARNTSCQRVEVVHTNGRITQQEIIDDLGIAKDDDAAMRRNLEAQGIKDVKRITLK